MNHVEIQAVSENPRILANDQKSSSQSFIQANTIESSVEEMKEKHIIPVFIKDNEPVISHTDFINLTWEMAHEIYDKETILQPTVRLSHPVKGRIPDAKDKPAIQLLEHEKTLYYERMAFVIDIPTVYDDIDGNKLILSVGGVKAYNLDNLYNKKGSDEHFKVFIGFKNTVCTNLCVWSDGFYGDLRVKSIGQLKGCIRDLFERYQVQYQMNQMSKLVDYNLTEQQFATLIGKCRMYQHLPHSLKIELPQLCLGDSQIGTVCRDFYKDDSFCRNEDGTINLWRLYNLFTGANKSSYIDNFLDRNVQSYHFIEQIRFALKEKVPNWYLN